MDFSFFTTNNKSGHKTKEPWFSENHPSEYGEIVSYCLPFTIETFKEKIWFYHHNLTELPKCGGCGGFVKFSGRFDRGYQSFCSLTCANTNGDLLDRVRKSNQEKYGVDYFTQHETFIAKQKVTKKERYGDENYNNQDKIKLTKILNHGDETFNNVDKQKVTSLERYGVSNPSKSKVVIDKIIKTNNERYGFNSPTQNDEVKLKLRESILNNIKSKFLDNVFVNYNFDLSEYTLKCGKCGTNYVIPMGLYNERKRLGYTTCTLCSPIGVKSTSKYEEDLFEMLGNVYSGDVVKNDRTVLGGKELDLYLPDLNLGIEVNGLYWHSDVFKDKDYHINKTKLCEDKGITLLHFFEDELLFKKDIITSILTNRVNPSGINKVYGRKCDIRMVDNKTSVEFLDSNHIQGGNAKASIRLGLYYSGELLSLMTFSRGRIAMGGKSDEWELVRFCNKLNTSVIGGASKLFKHFITVHEPKKVISYSDVRLFGGDLYVKLNFNKIHQSKPNYWYVMERGRYHRFNYRKSRLVEQGFDETKTEKQIMSERGYYRIYDCGNIRWEYTT